MATNTNELITKLKIVLDKSSFDNIQKSLSKKNLTVKTEIDVNEKASTNSIKNAMKNISKLIPTSQIIGGFTSGLQQAVKELEEIDTYLTGISKANDTLSKSELAKIADTSFDVAAKYGKKSTDYLSVVQEMTRAGYGNAALELSELSLLTQNVGDIEKELADKFLISADAAWKYGGNIENLRAILDGFNELSNKTTTDFKDLADGISLAGSTFAQAGLSAKDYAGIIGTATNKTQESGSEMARVWRTILMNIGQIEGTNSETDEVIDEDNLIKAETTLNDIGISIREIIDGQNELRNPMDIISELAEKWKNLSSIQQTAIQEALAGRLLPERIEMCA